MDAVEYLKTLARMHNKQEDCEHCILSNGCDGCDITKDEEKIKERVATVERWGKVNPAKTRKELFLAMFPNATLTEDGIPSALPCDMDRVKYKCDSDENHFEDHNCDCAKCHKEYWLEEVE